MPGEWSSTTCNFENRAVVWRAARLQVASAAICSSPARYKTREKLKCRENDKNDKNFKMRSRLWAGRDVAASGHIYMIMP